MTEKNTIHLTVILYVVLAYLFYPALHLTANKVPDSLYQYLTESFLSGHLHLLDPPIPELMKLSNPYDPTLNRPYKLYDASLYQGKYYLYFGPLPVITFYIPFKLLTSYYPSDALAAVFFLSLGFLVNFFLMIKIKEQYFPQTSQAQMALFGLLLGFTNGAPFLMSRPLMYEVAIASAYCFMSFALYFLYQILTQKSRIKDIFLFSLCLSLSVAGRPHFVLICFLLLPTILVYLLNTKSIGRHFVQSTPSNLQPTLKKYQVAALFIPAASCGLILALYNYLRFGNIFELGHIWQLSCNNMQDLYVTLNDLTKIPRNLLYGFYYYFLQPFKINVHYPYINLRWHELTYNIGGYFLEGIAGVLTTTPYILILLGLPKLIILYFKERTREIPLLWFVIFTAFIPLINALFLLLLPFAVQRYQMDFMPYFIMLAMITLWLWEAYSPHSKWFKSIRILFIISAIFSIIIGLSLGLAYWKSL